MRFLPVILFALTSCVSCRTIEKRNNSDTGASTIKANSTPTETHEEPLSYLEVSASGDTYAMTFKSEPEVFCERLCSHYVLIEDHKDGGVIYKATRTPILGNVNPSRLVEQRDLSGVGSDVKRVVVENVGKIGEAIVISDVTANGHNHFFATIAKLKSALAIGGESSGYTITFNGKSMDAAIDDQTVAAQLAGSAGDPVEGFVTGYVVTESKIERGDISVFHVLTFNKDISFE